MDRRAFFTGATAFGGGLAMGYGAGAVAADSNLPAADPFLQSGSGAVARSWRSKVGESVSVKDFGAIGDGVTNDAAAIGRAIAGAAGKALHFPAGQYLINSEIVVDQQIRIFGDGIKSTKIQLGAAAGAGKAAFRWSSYAQDVTAEDMWIHIPTAGGKQRGLRFAEARIIRLKNLKITGPGTADDTTGIQFDGAGTYTADVTIDSCYMTGHLIGIDFQGICTTVRVVNCEHYGTSGPIANSRGIKQSNQCAGLAVHGCTFTQLARGIYTEGTYISQLGNYYESNTVNWEWVRGSGNSRIWAMAFGEKQTSGGSPTFPKNNNDACFVVDNITAGGPYFGNVYINAGLGYRERLRPTAMGEWTTPAFGAGNFTANNAMTWTVQPGDVTTYAYTLVGKMMTVMFHLITTTVSGTPSTQLRITIPGGNTAAKRTRAWCQNFNNSTHTASFCEVTAGGTTINIYKDLTSATNWTTERKLTETYGQITLEIT
jgi:hypothetical protein